MNLPRRSFLLGAAGLAVTLAEGCTPVRYLFHADDIDFDRQGSSTERTLRAFVITVIPGIPPGDPELTRIYFDTRFPFRKIAGFFAADLRDRARSLSDRRAFDDCGEATRIRIIEQALESGDGSIVRMYRGAIFAAQVSCYGGIYGRGGCSLIDFPGPNSGYPEQVQFHPDAGERCAPGMTLDGNFA